MSNLKYVLFWGVLVILNSELDIIYTYNSIPSPSLDLHNIFEGGPKQFHDLQAIICKYRLNISKILEKSKTYLRPVEPYGCYHICCILLYWIQTETNYIIYIIVSDSRVSIFRAIESHLKFSLWRLSAQLKHFVLSVQEVLTHLIDYGQDCLVIQYQRWIGVYLQIL